jgi:hypothetical protein
VPPLDATGLCRRAWPQSVGRLGVPRHSRHAWDRIERLRASNPHGRHRAVSTASAPSGTLPIHGCSCVQRVGRGAAGWFHYAPSQTLGQPQGHRLGCCYGAAGPTHGSLPGVATVLGYLGSGPAQDSTGALKLIAGHGFAGDTTIAPGMKMICTGAGRLSGVALTICKRVFTISASS